MNDEYFLSINDVSKRLDVPAHTLRYWEKQFPAAIKPTTGAGGRRYYRTETVGALESIKNLLYNRGMTIAGVKKLLKDGNLPATGEFRAALDKTSRVLPTARKAPVAGDSTLFSRRSDIDRAINLLERAAAALKN
ncbi:MAG: MerR family transcriptional regulator [Rickettsiales bacterium]|jgi:DNA-binding transcriptional MerR regulator|nr:MerR family transcriptional regulator [Rickettsiales bacterium]